MLETVETVETGVPGEVGELHGVGGGGGVLAGKVAAVGRREASEGVAHDVEAAGEGGQPQQAGYQVLREGKDEMRILWRN